MLNDYELLQRYVEEGSEEAFSELVALHVGMVYSAALRQLWGNPHLAQDVAQMVFTHLARKAAEICKEIPCGEVELTDGANGDGQVTLAGWLHRDTRFAALAMGRKEHRRQAREQEAFKMQSLEQETLPDWREIRPWLDESLDELRPADREALLLRFFEQRTLTEVGAALGSGEDAARKRVNRALERLRDLLVSRGVTTTAGALSLVLSASAAQTVPAGFAKSLAQVAISGAGTAATASTGIVSLLTSAKVGLFFVTTAVLVVVGTAALKTTKTASSIRDAKQNHDLSQPAAQADARAGGGNQEIRAAVVAPVDSGTATSRDKAIADALEHIKEVLHDRKPVHFSPNPLMVEAIAALGDQRKAAVPILREALYDRNDQVSERAVDGLGIIGVEARETVSDLMTALRERDSAAVTDAAARALREMGPLPDLLPELGEIFKEKPSTRSAITSALSGLGQPELGLAGTDIRGVDTVFRPMLQNTDLDVRCRAANILALFLKRQAGADVINVALESVRAGDDNNLRVIALAALQNIASDPNRSLYALAPEVLGATTPSTIAALAEVVKSTKRNDTRSRALEMLNSLDPSFREHNPNLDAILKDREATDALCSRVMDGKASREEITDGLAHLPKAAPKIAEELAKNGVGGRAALPALRAALPALAPEVGDSGPDRSRAFNDRQRLANAVQKIAPDEPKILFGEEDMRSIILSFEELSNGKDLERKERIGDAVRPVLSGAPGKGIELTPSQMAQLLEALRNVDQEVYNAVLTRVLRIDSHFRETTIQSTAQSGNEISSTAR